MTNSIQTFSNILPTEKRTRGKTSTRVLPKRSGYPRRICLKYCQKVAPSTKAESDGAYLISKWPHLSTLLGDPFSSSIRGEKSTEIRGKIDNNYLKQFPEFQEFMSRKTSPKDNKDDEPEIMDSVSPDEKLNQALEEMNNALISDILTEISNHDPFFFENLVVDVIQAIYGGEFEGSSEVTQKTNDGGIDGVVKQDRLGFNSIYIQAKRHTVSIDRPEIQKFSGAMDGVHATNGAFITSSSFTEGAKVFVKQLNNKHIVLIDGRELAGLMIEYGIGVQTKKVVEIKKIDYDYFHPE